MALKRFMAWLDQAFTDSSRDTSHVPGDPGVTQAYEEGWQAGHNGLLADCAVILSLERREAWLDGHATGKAGSWAW